MENARFLDEDKEEGASKKEKKKPKKRMKIEEKYRPTIIRVTAAETIEEEEKEYETGGTLASPTLRHKNMRRASRFTIPENFEREEEESEDDLQIESSFTSSKFESNNTTSNNLVSSIDKIMLED